MTPILSVRNLTTSVSSGKAWKPLVHDISFDVGAAETVALVGESGSGKSITALSIMRLLPARSTRHEGEILFHGRDVLASSEAQMRSIRGNDISMIFQEPMTSLNPVMTIGAQIDEVLRAHSTMTPGEARAESIRMLDRVRIPSARSRYADYPHQFSGGMRQRVMIAMALACKPSLLIADEPTTALDVTIQGQIVELIKELQHEERMAVLFITHDLGVVAEIAHRAVVMFRGRVVEDEPCDRLFAQPSHIYTRALLQSNPVLGSLRDHPLPKPFPVIDVSTGERSLPAELGDTADRKAPPLLEVKGLCKRFDVKQGVFGRLHGRVHAVENVNFTLQPGETLSLVGESGCGKSTTGRSILRLTEPDRGSVKFDGKELLELGSEALRAARSEMQIVFQDPFASLNPRMTAGALVAEPILAHRHLSASVVAQKVADLLRRVGLQPEMADRLPHQFSGGQRQRIAIARALALEPKFVVADEAVSALDVSVKAQVINLMLELQASFQLAYLFISHDMAVVERVSHRVAVMLLGEIVEIGGRDQVLGNPQHDYTRKLLSAVPVPDPSRRQLRRHLVADEMKSPVRHLDYAAPVRHYREVSGGHFVMVSDGEPWESSSLGAGASLCGP